MSTLRLFKPLGQTIFKNLARPVTHALSSVKPGEKAALHQAADQFSRFIPPPSWVYHQAVVPPRRQVTETLDALKTNKPEGGRLFKSTSTYSAPKIKLPESHSGRLMSPSDPVITPLMRFLNPSLDGQPLHNLSVRERISVYDALKRKKSEPGFSSLKERVPSSVRRQSQSYQPGLKNAKTVSIPPSPYIPTPSDRILGRPLDHLPVWERDEVVRSLLKQKKPESPYSFSLPEKPLSKWEQKYQRKEQKLQKMTQQLSEIRDALNRLQLAQQRQYSRPPLDDFSVSVSPFVTQLALKKNLNFGPSFPQLPLSEAIECLKKPISTKWERLEQRLQKMDQQLPALKNALNRLHQRTEQELQSLMPAGYRPYKPPTLDEIRYGPVSD